MQTIFTGWTRGFKQSTRITPGSMTTTPEAQRRAMKPKFWKKHGREATKDVLHVSRSTLFEWQRRLQQEGSRLRALEPHSRRPKALRSMTTPLHVIERICTIRRAFPHYGQLNVELDIEKEKTQ